MIEYQHTAPADTSAPIGSAFELALFELDVRMCSRATASIASEHVQRA